jgi:hypothetical protein
MHRELITVTPDPVRDPDGSGLYRVLEATLASSRMRSLREGLLLLVALSSIPLGAAALRPGLLPHIVRNLGLGTWVVGCVALSAAWIAELRWERRLAHRLHEVKPQEGKS